MIEASHLTARKWLARTFLVFMTIFMLTPVLYMARNSVTFDDRFGLNEPNLQFTLAGWKRLFGQSNLTKWNNAVYFSPGDTDVLNIGIVDGLMLSIDPSGRIIVLPPEPWVLTYPEVKLRLFAEGLSNNSADNPRGEELIISTRPSEKSADGIAFVNATRPTFAQLELPPYSESVHRIRINYEYVWLDGATDSLAFQVAGNSLKLATIATSIVIVMSILMAYALVRLRIVLKAQITGLVLIAQMFPSFLLITTYVNVFYWLGEQISWLGRDSHVSVTLIYLGSLTLSVFLILGYFKQVDSDMEESAFVDGATPFQALMHILLPLSKPIIAVAFLVAFIFFYSEFNISNRFLSGERMTFSGFTMDRGYYGNPENHRAAMLLMSCLPVLVLFLFLRRHLISGLVDGSTKG